MLGESCNPRAGGVGAGRCLGLPGLAYLVTSRKVRDPVWKGGGGGGGGGGAGKEEKKGFYLSALGPSCGQLFISLAGSSGDPFTLTTAPGGLQGHPLLRR